MRSELLLPASIFAGAIVVALGAYFGLRAQRAGGAGHGDLATTAPVASSASSIALAAGGALSSPSSVSSGALGAAGTIRVEPAPVLAPEGIAPSNERVARAALSELEKQRARFVKTCLEPAARDAGARVTVSVSFTVAFDKNGHEQLRGIVERGAAVRPDVVDCLRGVEGPLTIPATGAPVTVEVPLTFP